MGFETVTGGDTASPAARSLVRAHLLAPLAHSLGWSGFHRDFVTSAVAAEVRGRQLEQAIAALARRQVPVVLLKGVSVASTLYVDPAHRPMTDIDLMVPSRAMGRGVLALESLGYRVVGTRVSRSRFHHATTLRRGHAAIDLHQSVLQPLRAPLDLDAVWRRTHPAQDTPGARHLDPADEALFLLLHIARSELIVPLINYVDVARSWRDLDRAGRVAVVDRARAGRLSRAVSAAAHAVETIAGVALGSFARARRLQPDRQAIARGLPPSRPIQIARKLALLDGPRDVLALARVFLLERGVIGFAPRAE